MTRKDYVVVADVLNEYKYKMHMLVFEDLIDSFSNMFKSDNPNFRFDKFYEACNKSELDEFERMQSGTRYNVNI